MLKRSIVIPMLVFIGVLAALIFTSINGYLINQLAPIDKFPAIYRFLEGRSEQEKSVLMAIAIVVFGLLAALASWMVTKLPEWMGPKDAPIAALESGRRMRLIMSQVNEVNDRLKDALARSAMISLEFEDASDQVDQPALKDLKKVTPIVAPVAPKGIFDRMKKLTFWKGTDVELPPQMKMIEVFRRRDVSGRLLILGHPGAGKTTTLLELAQELLVEAQEAGATRIPHVFEMSRWEEGRSIVEYLAIELKQMHNLDLAVGRGMAASGELLPLLDGLDELRDPKVISAAMGAINTYLAQSADRDAVVCCRVLDYELASEQLRELNGAIELQPLSEGAIRRYLTDVGKGTLWDLVEQNPALVRSSDPNILPLLKTPLFLSVFALLSPIVAVKSEGELWDAYIVKQLGIPAEKLSGKGYKRYKGTEEPTQKQTKNYLIFLAQQLRRTTEVMLIEEMQPTWLRSEPKVLGRSVQQWRYCLSWSLIVFLIMCLILCLISGLIIGLFLGLTQGLLVGLQGLLVGLIIGLVSLLIWGLIGGLLLGLIMGLLWSLIEISPRNLVSVPILGEILNDLRDQMNTIEPVEELQISISSEARKMIFKHLIMGLVIGSILCLTMNLILGLITGLTMGLTTGLIISFKTNIKVRLETNQGIKASVKNMVILMPISVIPWGFLQIKLIPYLQEFVPPVELQIFPGAVAVVIVLMTVIAGGGLAFIQHVSLRITLYFSHQKPNETQTRCIPWNYARFLSYAADRKLLQQTGGAYRFIHRSLLEHFAGMEN